MNAITSTPSDWWVVTNDPEDTRKYERHRVVLFAINEEERGNYPSFVPVVTPLIARGLELSSATAMFGTEGGILVRGDEFHCGCEPSKGDEFCSDCGSYF